ncbi:MAG: DUF2251 domain-containing protein [Bradyrhizobiaceae bacterium]|nr:DUF2251 domain-containing protein [Bradyrhizobiaceae bacterium]
MTGVPGGGVFWAGEFAESAGADMAPKQLVASVVTRETIRVGDARVVQSGSSMGRYQAVFEDDGATGYFYALDMSRSGNPIVDALHVYDVNSVADRDQPRDLQILWSSDGLKTVLFLNSYPHAIYNFEDRRGCCRTGFPPAAIGLGASHDWQDAEMEHFHAQ